KVLRVLPSLEMGGVEKTLISLLPHLEEKGFTVKVCTLYRKDILAKELEKIGIPVINIGMRARIDIDLKYLRGIFHLAEFIRKEKFHIVHTHLYRANTPGRIAAILARVPIIIANEHNVDSWKRFSQRRMDRFLAKFTDKIIVVSNEVKKFYVNEVGIPDDKLEVIYNGVDLKRFEKDFDKKKKRKELGLPLSSPLVGTIGRLQLQKDHKTFLKASSLILKKFPKVHFLIVGGGSLRKELENFTRNLKIEKNVHFLGERKDIEEILPLMDIFVLTSKREGFPITVLEAMACSIPVVATSVGGTPELIEEGKTGFLIPPENPHILSEAIINLLKNEELGKEMGKYGKERVKSFSIEKMVEKTEFLYDKLLQTKLGIKNKRENENLLYSLI
ncbi:GT4 family glycosyltransferase PelF, partial [Candidatus Calescamantes bacterium]|nr:GT4 family glycosyltransferase PelF [Candidatus Calescamantes bacterium]